MIVSLGRSRVLAYAFRRLSLISDLERVSVSPSERAWCLALRR